MSKDAQAPPEVPGYAIDERLGAGGTADVFGGRLEGSTRPVAIKVLHRRHVGKAGIARRMRTEWLVGRDLDHLNLLRILDYGELADGRPWLAMERLDGPDLAQVLKREGPLPPMPVIRIAQQVCAGLAVLHRRGAVHRDVKPHNLVRLADDRRGPLVKLVDFGLLALPHADSARAHPTTGRVAVGTPEYMAPEQALSQAVDGRTDLYALGVVLYQLLSGSSPFADERRGLQALVAHVHHDPVPLRERAAGVPPSLARLIHACLEKRPFDRPPSAEAVGESLAEIYLELIECGDTLRIPPAASVPPIPDASHVAGFDDALLDWVDERWLGAPPAAVADARGRLADQQTGLAVAERLSLEARREADLLAAELIRRQAELEVAVSEVARDLAMRRAALAVRAGQAFVANQRYDRTTEAYREAVTTLAESLGDDDQTPAEVSCVAAAAEEAAATRVEAAFARTHRRGETAAELGAAQDLDAQLETLQASLTAVERERSTRGARAEARATAAADALDAAHAVCDHARLALLAAALRQHGLPD